MKTHQSGGDGGVAAPRDAHVCPLPLQQTQRASLADLDIQEAAPERVKAALALFAFLTHYRRHSLTGLFLKKNLSKVALHETSDHKKAYSHTSTTDLNKIENIIYSIYKCYLHHAKHFPQ